jgi:hypothetical protein
MIAQCCATAGTGYSCSFPCLSASALRRWRPTDGTCGRRRVTIELGSALATPTSSLPRARSASSAARCGAPECGRSSTRTALSYIDCVGDPAGHGLRLCESTSRHGAAGPDPTIGICESRHGAGSVRGCPRASAIIATPRRSSGRLSDSGRQASSAMYRPTILQPRPSARLIRCVSRRTLATGDRSGARKLRLAPAGGGAHESQMARVLDVALMSP